MASAARSEDDAVTSVASEVRKFVEAKETTPDLLRETLWRFVDLARDTLKSQRRVAILLVALAFAFELLNRSLVNEASLAGIKLSRPGFLATLTPAAISYLYLRFASSGRDLNVYLSVVYCITSHRFLGLNESRLDSMVVAVGGPTLTLLPRTYAPHWRRMTAGMPLSELAVYNFLPFGFVIYAFWQLFTRHGTGDPLIWASLIASTVLLVTALGFVAMGVRLLNQPELERDRDDMTSAFR
jgi:hypothetical protein